MMVLHFLGYLLDVGVDCVNRTRRIDPKTFRLGFPDTSRFSEVLTARSFARQQPN